MRNLVFLSIFILISAVSCKKSVSEQVVNSDADSTALALAQNQLRYDSVIVHDSVRLSDQLVVEFRQKSLVFEGLNKELKDSLYKSELYEEIPYPEEYTVSVVGELIRKRMQNYFKEYRTEEDPYRPSMPQTWTRFSSMDVFSETPEFLTLMHTGHGYTGGAHGYAFEHYKVADLKSQKIVKLNDIVDVSKVNWNQILIQNLGNRKDELFEPQTLTFNDNFYFDENSLVFVYGQYEITPYASGIVEIKVPFSQISDALHPGFRQRLDMK